MISEGTVRVLATDLAAQTREVEHLRAQVTELQAANTRLVEERREMDWTSQVSQLFVLFDQVRPDAPAFPDDATIRLRRKMCVEEHDEMIAGLDGRDMIETVDGAIDTVVVALGLLVALGVNPRPLWAEVQRTNVAKRGPGAWKSADGKMMKPPGWTPPDIAGLLREQGWRP